ARTPLAITRTWACSSRSRGARFRCSAVSISDHRRSRPSFSGVVRREGRSIAKTHGEIRMRSMVATLALGSLCVVVATVAHAQAGGPGTPWRGAGPQPCFGIDDFATQCAAPARTIVIRAGRVFDSNSGRLVNERVIVIRGDRITDIGTHEQVKIPE